jgi:hypothetical protein
MSAVFADLFAIVGNHFGVGISFGQKIENCRKDGELSIPGVTSPGGAGYDFGGNQSRIGWRGG